MKVSDSTVLVSGGSSGLGGACVRLLALAGANVVIADLNQETGDKLAAEFAPRVRFAKTEVTDEKSVQAAVDLAVKLFGGLHVSIQCAGIAVAEKLLGKSGPHGLA